MIVNGSQFRFEAYEQGDYGDHVIVHGDCLDVMKRMPDKCVDLVLTDPPFNVGKDYGEGTDDKQDPEEYWSWLNHRLSEVIRIMNDGRFYMFHTDKGMFQLRPLLEQYGLTYGQMLIWFGPNLVGGARIQNDWHYSHEPCLLMRKGKRGPMINSRYAPNCFSVQVIPRPQRNFKEGRHHVAQKPTKLFLRILARTPGNLVLDPFLGSGTTLVAAKQLGRRGIGIEIEHKYCLIAQERLRQEVLKL